MSMIFSILHESAGWLVSHSGSNVLIIRFHNIDVAALYVKEKGTVWYHLCGTVRSQAAGGKMICVNLL